MQIYQLQSGVTADYASSELSKYIYEMCGENTNIRFSKGENGIALGLFSDFGLSYDRIEDNELDDAYEIKVNGFCGYIAGSNIRSILYGVYAYLKKAGCRFIRPGRDGEYIPKVDLSSFTTELFHKAHHRYRGDCIEGAVSYEVIRDEIEWLPKVGYNCYMLQATAPYLWYARYYEHQGNKNKTPEPLSTREADIITRKLEKDIKRCGLSVHSVGHDYMAPAFGLFGSVTEEDIDKRGIRKYLAKICGERKIFRGGIRYTNFCYSNPEVRKAIVNYLAEYVTEKPEVDFLHLWLSDSPFGCCECEECRKMPTPSDMYFSLLNEVDKAFSEKGIDTKIVFIQYNDTAWAPKRERLNNPSRFLFLNAVKQDYITGYTEYEKQIPIPEYRLNENTATTAGFPMNINFFREWKKCFGGDSFFFEYHLYSDHYCDPGYVQTGSRLMRDLKLLDAVGTNGYMHCSTPRKQMPTSYPMYMAGMLLNNPTLSEEEIIKEYYSAAFGDDWEKVYDYLSSLSELFCPDFLRARELAASDEMFTDTKVVLQYMYNPDAAESFGKIPAVIDGLRSIIEKNLKSDDPCIRKSWDILRLHAPIAKMLAEGLLAGAEGDMKKAQDICRKIVKHLSETEDEYFGELDFMLLYRRLKLVFGFATHQFSPVTEEL